MKQYLKKIIDQFVAANGIKNPDIYSEQFIQELLQWIKLRKNIAKEYTYFIDYMGFEFYYSDCAEIGKGQQDSIVIPFKTRIITPAAETFEYIEQERIISGNMCVEKGTPLLVRNTQNDCNSKKEIPRDIIRTYMTQNPYTIADIRGWEDLHNSGSNDIIVGVYGSIYDADMNKKIESINSFIAKIQTPIKEDMTYIGDSYFYAIGSERTLKKIKVKKK